MRTRTVSVILCLCLTALLFQAAFEPVDSETSTRTSARNMAGDEDSLPQNQTFLDLKGATHQFSSPASVSQILIKDFIKVGGGCQGTTSGITIEKLFDGTNQDCDLTPNEVFFTFGFPINITMLRIYPMGNSGLKCNDFALRTTFSNTYWNIATATTVAIAQSSDYVEIKLDSFITTDFWFDITGGFNYLNEIEIYYNPDLTPYWYNPLVNTTYYNTTNTTYNDFYNITYDNTTYENHTHLNHTDQHITYENTTDQHITYDNTTYVNLTNQTTVQYENFTDMFYPIEYHNTTADLTDLQNRLDNLSNELDETKAAAEEAGKEGKAEPGPLTYLNTILLIVLIILAIMLYLRKPKPGIPSDTSSSPTIEHVPTPGKFSHEEKSIIRSDAPVKPVAKQQPVKPLVAPTKPATPPSKQLTTGELEGWEVGK